MISLVNCASMNCGHAVVRMATWLSVTDVV